MLRLAVIGIFLSAQIKAEYEWQKVGACGIPANKPNLTIFSGIDAVDQNQVKEANQDGQNRPNGRIVGGVEAIANSWPWQVYLEICGKWWTHMECNICGGSIISPKYLISAAHCVPTTLSKGTIVHGSHQLSTALESNKVAIFSMKEHYAWNPYNFNNDISIVTAKTDIAITPNTSPICLPHKSTCFDIQTACVVTGYGLTNQTSNKFSDKLREVAVRLMSDRTCYSYTNYAAYLTENMLCAGYTEGLKDACAGDSGGPLVCRLPDTNAWILYGIVSWGYGCAQRNNPGVYTKVTNMLDFIEKETGQVPDDRLDAVNYDNKCHHIGSQEKKWEEENLVKISDDASWFIADNDWLVDFREAENQFTLGKSKTCNYEDTSSTNDYLLSASTGWVQNANYGSNYLENVNCSWRITNDNPAYTVEITLDKTRVNCKKSTDEGLYITGLTQYMDTQMKYCKTKKNRVVKRDPRGFVIDFITDSAQDWNKHVIGFKLSYKLVDSSHVCKGSRSTTLKQQRPTKFDTEFFPRPYSPSSQCRWHIHVKDINKDNPRIRLFIARFNTEGGACGRGTDNLLVFKAPNCDTETLRNAESNSQLWGGWCGDPLKSGKLRFTIYAPSICVLFLADGDGNTGNGVRFFSAELA